ncbi:lipid II:glycine glycyltransferase FemX [Arthrobacter castelli]|uniref:lipid II:glycine glycyltransferase FemX n=1 Tax=Arthrobacter castelli TaxID=271431 RepID=UPI00040917BC|nr:peptidoglycan bridge formation glycyltransferase FemA/FemB family protein [Arthrobacter castelli]
MIARNPDGGNVFQGRDFVEHKTLTGWRAKYANVDDVAVSILEKPVPGLGKLWYIPKGPGVARTEQLARIVPSLNSLAQASGAFAVKVEPEIQAGSATRGRFTGMGLVKVPDVQPNSSTVVVDIDRPVDEVVAGFKGKTRSHIRAAERAGVTTTVVPATDANCAHFYRLLAETAEGNFRIRSERYYRLYWQRHVRSGTGMMLFATVDGRIVAADFLMLVGNKAARKDAASSRNDKIRGAAALLEVEAVNSLREAGIAEYDLCGAPPSAEARNRDHPLHGVGAFKTGFNNDITDYVGTWEQPIATLSHALWRKAGERAALSIHNRLHGENYY